MNVMDPREEKGRAHCWDSHARVHERKSGKKGADGRVAGFGGAILSRLWASLLYTVCDAYSIMEA